MHDLKKNVLPKDDTQKYEDDTRKDVDDLSASYNM